MPALPHAQPDQIGFSATRLQLAYDLLEQWTDGPDAPIPGAALLVGRKGQTVEPRFFGRHGAEKDAKPIRRDGTFLLASITKPVTCLGAMLLVERGLLGLNDLVTRYIPEFAAHHKDQTRVVHLMTHTSGLPDMLENNIELRREHAPLARFCKHVIHDTVPSFAPGTNVSYQSMGTLMVAEIVERITGQPLPRFLEQEIFEPLGLTGTSLGLGSLDAERIVGVRVPEYLSGGDYHWNSSYWRQLGAPWGGMFSAPEDFAQICRLMLDGGRAGGAQLVSRATIERMSSNRLNDLPEVPEPLRRTQPWGLGWRLNHAGMPDTFGDLVGPRTYGHLGATGTMAWIDPDAQAFCLIFTTAPLEQSHGKLVQLSNIVAAAIES